MRPGLVAIGVAFLTVAGGTAASVFALPQPSTERQVATDVPPSELLPNQTRGVLLSGVTAASGTFSVRWQATGPVRAQLFDAPGCLSASSSCVHGAPVAVWPLNNSGSYACTGKRDYPYLLEWTDTGSNSVSVQASSVSRESDLAPAPTLMLVLIGIAVAALGSVGALGLFLGLFLRRGYSKGPPRLTSQDPDDAASIADRSGGSGPTGPRTGSTPFEDGAPHRELRAPDR